MFFTLLADIAFLYRAPGSLDVSGGSAFSDVAANAYYADAAAWADTEGKNAKKTEEYIRNRLEGDGKGEQRTMGSF